MNGRQPELIAINRDDYHAEHIGRTLDGRQFFLTRPFEPSIGDKEGAEYVALFPFDADGNFLDAKIDNLGPRESHDKGKRRQCYKQRLCELGNVTFGRIEIKPFAIEQFGTTSQVSHKMTMMSGSSNSGRATIWPSLSLGIVASMILDELHNKGVHTNAECPSLRNQTISSPNNPGPHRGGSLF